MANEFKDVIARLEKQKTAIERALAALRDVDDSDSAATATPQRGPRKGTKRKMKISAEARKRMSDAQKKRWAAVKSAAKQAGRKAAKAA